MRREMQGELDLDKLCHWMYLHVAVNRNYQLVNCGLRKLFVHQINETSVLLHCVSPSAEIWSETRLIDQYGTADISVIKKKKTNVFHFCDSLFKHQLIFTLSACTLPR